MIDPDIEIQLPSGESLTAEEIVTGFLLLARHESATPVVTSTDALLSVLQLLPAVWEFNDAAAII